MSEIAGRLVAFAITAVVLLAVSFSGATAQLSQRPITIVVPYSPGTGPDILARTIGEELRQRWNQPVVVDNQPGASGNIGTYAASRAVPDGHTLVMVTNPFTANLSLMKSVPYDPVTGFVPIIYVATGTLALAVHPSLPVNSTQEFIAFAKARPGQINYGSPGVGTPHHLAMELFKITTKVNMMHIPYRGSAGATTDLIGGHVSVAFQAIHVILPFAHQNQVRLLAVASKERVRVAPDLPTLHEQGLTGFEVNLWEGLLAPLGTPRHIIIRYNEAFNEILSSPPVIEKLAKQGLTVVGGTPEQFSEFLASDVTKWQKILNEAGIRAE